MVAGGSGGVRVTRESVPPGVPFTRPGAAGYGCYTAAMKRSVQEIVELLVFALIALLVGTGLVWLVGWLMSLVGFVFQWLAGLVWSLLRFAVPVAIVAAAVYALVKLLQRQESRVSEGVDNAPKTGTAGASTVVDTPAAPEAATARGGGGATDVEGTTAEAASTDVEASAAPARDDAAAVQPRTGDEFTDPDRQVSASGTEVTGASPSPADTEEADAAATDPEPRDAALRREEGAEPGGTADEERERRAADGGTGADAGPGAPEDAERDAGDDEDESTDEERTS